MTFGEKVKFVRIKLKLTQAQLAKETGIPEITIAKWETHNIKPQAVSYGKFIEYCEKHNIRFDENKN